uniref:Uncharacterized protein n=1 Tax=Peronospora matthiolae TaxID=2874970 RepID=A0AAV1UGB7_9STRA
MAMTTASSFSYDNDFGAPFLHHAIAKNRATGERLPIFHPADLTSENTSTEIFVCEDKTGEGELLSF